MEEDEAKACLEDLQDLAKDYKELEVVNREYLAKLEEIEELQAKCMKGIAHQRYRMAAISKSLKPIAPHLRQSMREEMARREQQLHEMEQSLPKPNGTYLSIILGSVNVSILNKSDKFKYKDEYEKFKLVLSVIGFALSVLNLFTNVRTLELSFMFLLVWYYCTLTIRESILKVNGSRIKGWWRFHHFLSTAVSGVLLVWPNTGPYYAFRGQFMWFNVYIISGVLLVWPNTGPYYAFRGQFMWFNVYIISGVLLVWPNTGPYYAFRGQFMWFNVYISFVQYLQFRYQRGVLYRLKALGERHNMDITIEGFHSWMWRGLSFLLPFLFVGYFFQLYNAYVLASLINHSEATWHVPVLSIMFLVLFLGNMITTVMVIPQKLQKTATARLSPSQTRAANEEQRTKAQQAESKETGSNGTSIAEKKSE